MAPATVPAAAPMAAPFPVFVFATCCVCAHPRNAAIRINIVNLPTLFFILVSLLCSIMEWFEHTLSISAGLASPLFNSRIFISYLPHPPRLHQRDGTAKKCYPDIASSPFPAEDEPANTAYSVAVALLTI
jgi:hypothetical protein